MAELSMQGKGKAKVYTHCLIYGSETRPMKVEQEVKLDEMSMIRESEPSAWWWRAVE